MQHKKKINVGVIFGGRSAEHEVSLVSASSVINALDKKKYNIIPIGITKDGEWISGKNILNVLKSKLKLKNKTKAILLPEPIKKNLLFINDSWSIILRKHLDVIFPILHGTYGEDGTIQGLFELTNIPYVGAGVLGSSVGMDKVITKQLCEGAKIPVSPFIWFTNKDYSSKTKNILSTIENKIGYPCFIKPANLGSSVGISKARNKKELVDAIEIAFKYDRKILIEKSIENSREIEVSILGNDEPIASIPGEIISSNEFYDYDAKYIDGKSKSIIPAKLPASVIKKIKELAIRSFKTINCYGMARVDFLLTRRSNKIYFNEINTIPGFTSISMYPKLWEASGIPYSELLDRLILLAIDRHKEKSKLKTTFRPKKEWYA
jgi:D-alanine-D-alanine ligase